VSVEFIFDMNNANIWKIFGCS